MRRQRRSELLEGAPHVVAERRAGERLDERPTEVKRAQLGHGETGGEPLEGLAVQAPARAPVVARSIVEDRKAGFLERLQVAPDRPRRDVAERRELVDRHAGGARALDLPEDGPLADHLGVSGHAEIVQSGIPVPHREHHLPVVSLFLFLAAFVGGALNAVAGGGSFIGLPALIFAGVPAVSANATNTLALWPASASSAWAYRREVSATRSWIVSLGGASLAGGIIGGFLLLRTSDAAFVRLLPWLLLVAAVTFSFGGVIQHLVGEATQHPLARWRAAARASTLQAQPPSTLQA